MQRLSHWQAGLAQSSLAPPTVVQQREHGARQTTTTQMAGQGWSSICVSVLVSVLRRELCFGPVFPIAIARDVDRAPTTCPAALSINIAAASLF
jgi:hypothetical protein